MKKSLFTFLVFLSGMMVYAQDAKNLLDKVKNNYQKATTYYIKFNLENGGKSYQGEVFSLKEKFNLNVMDVNQIYDGKKLYTISNDDKEVTISNSQNMDDLLTPTKILNSYTNDFTYKLDKKQTIGGQPIQFIKFTPKNNQSSVQYALLGVNTNNNQIYQYKEVSKGNQTTSITVKEYLENLIIHKSYFNFDSNKYKSKGYVVTQL